MPLPYPGMDAVPFTPLTAAFLDQMIANDAALQNWSAFDAATLPPSLILGSSEGVFDYIVPGGAVLAGSSYGSTLGWTLSAGVVYINGKRYTIASTSGTVTASKDTYFDVLQPGSGTVATLVNTGGNIVANNAASPALAANSVRLGIIVSGASSIAAAASVNQGEENKVLPIASSVPYAVTDSLGNLICPRDRSRKLLGYRQSLVSFTTTSTAVVQVTALSIPVIIPANRKIKISVYTDAFGTTAGANVAVASLWDGVVVSGTKLTQFNSLTGTAVSNNPSFGSQDITITPTAGSKTYNLGLNINISGTATWGFTATPAYIKVELA